MEGFSFGAVIAADAGKWTCDACNCKWGDDVLQCQACEIGLKPGVSKADIDAKKTAVLDLFKMPVSDAPKASGFGGFGATPSSATAPTSLFGGASASSASISFGFGAGGAAPASSIAFGFASSSSVGISFGAGSGGDAKEPSGGHSGGAIFGFGSTAVTTAAPTVSFGSGTAGGFVFKPAASEERKNQELVRKKTKRLASEAFPAADAEAPCHVYVMGSGECEQLGLGDDILERKKPHMIPERAFGRLPVVSIAVGGLHSIAVLENGQLYSWGCNDDGVLGRTGAENVPGLVTKLHERSVRVAHIGCGDCHSAAVDATGKVWIWGSYKDGGGHIGFPDFDAAGRDKSATVQTPSGDTALKQPFPVQVPGLASVAMLHCGGHHTVVGAQKGSSVELWSWGDNAVGQLGQCKRTPEPPTDADDAVREPKYKAWKRNKVKLLYPCRLDMGPWIASGRVELIGGGSDCTFVVVAPTNGPNYETYCVGLNGDFQLGIGKNSEAEVDWTRVPALSGVRPQIICGGSSNTAVLDSSGDVWCWGRGERSGHLQKTGAIKTPQRIDREAFGGVAITRLSAGGTHMMACAENGDVFTWGTGETHQLGNVPKDVDDFTKEEKDSNEPPPELSPYILTSGKLKDKFIVAAAGGAQHSVLLVWNGEKGKKRKRKGSLCEEEDGRPTKMPRLEILCKPSLLDQCLKELAKVGDPREPHDSLEQL